MTSTKSSKVLEFNQQMSFQLEEDNQNVLPIDFVKYQETRYCTLEELFEGFDVLHALTFSISLPFVKKVVKWFKSSKIILGCEAMAGNDVCRLMAHQTMAFNDIKSDDFLVNKIRKEELEIRVVKELVSHRKVYVMYAEDGRRRVICGSPNASERAWDGSQLENWDCYDNDRAMYDTCLKRFYDLYENSTNEIVKQALEKRESDITAIDDIPMFDEIKRTNKIMIFEDSRDSEEIEYEIDMNNLMEKYKDQVLPALKQDTKNNSVNSKRIVIEPRDIERINEYVKKGVEQKKTNNGKDPELIIDYDKKAIFYKGMDWLKRPDKEKIIKDLLLLKQYMDGFDSFRGNVEKTKESYYKVLNYMFMSPFLPYLRYQAYISGIDNYDTLFPIYLMITGEPSTGKTKFIRTVYKLMFDNNMVKRCDKDFFTKKNMFVLKNELKGVPVFFDEMTPTSFKYAKEIVKQEDYLVDKKIINHPAFIIASNSFKEGITYDISKRFCCINFEATANPDSAVVDDSQLTSIRRKMGHSLYSEYLRRMIDRVVELSENINKKVKIGIEEIVKIGWFPDIFELSTEVLHEIYEDCDISIPDEFRKFNWYDCCGADSKSGQAVTLFMDIWNYSKKYITIDKHKDIVKIDLSHFSPADQKKKANILKNGLVRFDTTVSAEGFIIKGIKEVEDYFDIKFGWFGRK